MTRCYSGTWESAIEEFAVTTNADALHVHDLPLLGPALKVAGKMRIPVVADLHENYPAMLDVTLKVPFHQITSLGSLASRLSVSVSRWSAYEASAVPQAQRVITVIEEARDRVVGMGVSAERVTVVSNYATLDEVDERQEATSHPIRHENSELSLVYAGGFGPTRDLITVLEAVKALPTDVRSEINVTLIGGMGKDLAQLKQHAAELGIEENVSLLPWLPRPEAERLMLEADVGLVPHVKNAHTDATVPHKLFQYMWRRLPVIVSNCAPLERIVHEADCGLVYPSGDSQALARCLTEMHGRKDRVGSMGEAGHNAVAQKYNWEKAGEALLKVYRGLA
jgi:glycosyltransferase involved in cell wall biosynthesis